MRLLALYLLLQLPLIAFGQGKKILSQHLEQYGQSIWAEINTLKIEGKHVTQNYEAFPLVVFINENQEIRVEAISRSEGYILTLNQTEFWSRNYSEKEINSSLEALVLDHAVTIGSPLAKYPEEIKYFGLEAYKDETYHTFKKEKDNYSISYLIDKENHELRYITCSITAEVPMIAVLYFQKYKSHHGLMMPTAMTIEVENEYKEWVFDEIFLGISLKDQLFQPTNSQ